MINAVVRAHCGRCNGIRNCDVKGTHSEKGEEGGGQYYWTVDWYLLVCRGCDFPFAQTVATDSENVHQYYDENNEYAQEYIEDIRSWPAKSKRQKPDWFKHGRIEGLSYLQESSLNNALNELYLALDSDLLILSSIGIRTAFDAASEVLEIETGLSFERKLKALVEKGKIRESESDALKVLIEAGSAAAHRGWKPRPNQLDVQMDILEEFILNSMVLPARQKKKEDEVKKLKMAVPPKERRPSKKNAEANASGTPPLEPEV